MRLAGRRRAAQLSSGTGRYRRAIPPPSHCAFDVAVDATLRAAALRRCVCPNDVQFEHEITERDPRANRLQPLIAADDLRAKLRQHPRKALVVFVVDASESMRLHARMAVAKAAALSLLATAYLTRDRVALVVFGGERADVVLHPTNSITQARDRLRRLPAGGATPLADALSKAHQLVLTDCRKNPGSKPWLVVLSDGEANVPLRPGRNVTTELEAIAAHIRRGAIRTVVFDTNPTSTLCVHMKRLAEWMGGTYHPLERLRSQDLVDLIRTNTNEPSNRHPNQ